MRLQISRKRDARKLLNIGAVRDDVIDLDTGKSVGYVETETGGWTGDDQRISTRRVYLFDGKYTGACDSFQECVAFVSAVESVLNHMISAKSNG